MRSEDECRAPVVRIFVGRPASDADRRNLDFSSDVAPRDGAFGERFPVLSGSKRREKDVSLSDLFPRIFQSSTDASHSIHV